MFSLETQRTQYIVGYGNIGKQVEKILQKNGFNDIKIVKSIKEIYKDNIIDREHTIHFCKNHDYIDFVNNKFGDTEYDNGSLAVIYNYTIIDGKILQKIFGQSYEHRWYTILLTGCTTDMMVLNDEIINRPCLELYIPYYLSIENKNHFLNSNIGDFNELCKQNKRAVELCAKYIQAENDKLMKDLL